VAGGVFINYRGADSRSYGALLYAELSRHYGADHVFLDSESIPAGADFAQALLARVRGCRVLLAVIGPRWLTTAGADGRLIDDPADWVRRELVEAFVAGVRVIPVLTDDADLPAEADLPAQIAALGRCQYRRLRHRDAIADLDRLRADIAADPVLHAAARRHSPARTSRLDWVPAQLPADVYGFAGRTTHLARLDGLLADVAAQAPTAVVITAVSGTAGVGKTALAVHWAHRIADQFPDGQLYVNLRGYDPGGQILEPATAVRGFLEALGVAAERVPADRDAQAALYRSLLAGKRVLVVIDNARDGDHARPLLPGTATALAVVTSRSQLTDLVAADGAQAIPLDLLDDDEARDLLGLRIGPDRVAADPAAIDQIVTACRGLPLALALVAARAATNPTFNLSALAAELDRAGDRVARLDAGDVVVRVRAVFSWSYTALGAEAARLFRLLGLHPGPDISTAAAASLAATPPEEAVRLLGDLTRAGLLSEQSPGRYGFHDLLAAYAANLTHTTDADDERRAATVRLLDYYTHTAHTADRRLHTTRDPMPVPLLPPAVGACPEQLVGDSAALGWLTAERRALLATLRLAAAADFDTHTWQLAWALTSFLIRRGHWHDLASAWQAALASADRLTPVVATAHAYRRLAWAGTELGRYEDAYTQSHRALDLYVAADDRVGQAHTHRTLAVLWERQDRPDRALDHAQQALALYQSTDHRRRAGALNGVGWCQALLGHHAEALAHCREALTLQEQTGDRWGAANSWTSLAYAHHHLGQFAQAADCSQHALTLYRQLGAHHNEAIALTRLGDAQHAIGLHDAARTAWTQALDVLADADHPAAKAIRTKLDSIERPNPPTDPAID